MKRNPANTIKEQKEKAYREGQAFQAYYRVGRWPTIYQMEMMGIVMEEMNHKEREAFLKGMGR